MKEVWKNIPSFKGFYQASSLGRIRACSREVRFLSKNKKEFFRLKKFRICAQQIQNSGYFISHLHVNGIRKAVTVHSLVAESFLGKRPFKKCVCHKNGNKTDNRIVNLRYDSWANNSRDRLKHGTFYASATAAKLNQNQVKKIRKLKNLTQNEIAQRFKVRPETIRRLLKRETWKHVK